MGRPRKTRCIRGHDLLDEDNLYEDVYGFKRCKACRALRLEARRLRPKRLDTITEANELPRMSIERVTAKIASLPPLKQVEQTQLMGYKDEPNPQKSGGEGYTKYENFSDLFIMVGYAKVKTLKLPIRNDFGEELDFRRITTFPDGTPLSEYEEWITRNYPDELSTE